MKNILITPLYIAVLVAQVDYDTVIQPLWNSNCISCHIYGHSSGLNLTSGNSYDDLVDVTSNNYSPALRVASGAPGSSVLYDKITGKGVADWKDVIVTFGGAVFASIIVIVII